MERAPRALRFTGDTLRKRQERTAMPDLSGKKIAILATHGFERSELESPRDQLREWGAEVHVVSPESGEIRSWDKTDWGPASKVDADLAHTLTEDYHALVIPGGQINPDILRANDQAVGFVRGFLDAGKPVAAICHGPWLLVEADALRGLKATSYKSIRTDLKNAGAEVVDEQVVCDNGIITSRNPGDLEAFNRKIAEKVEEGAHYERAA
jgi:protease I